MAEMKSPNAHARENRNDTPRKRKTHIIKVRVTAEEKLRIAYACKELHLTQSELVRRVLYGVNVKHTVVVAQGGEDALAALAALSAQCSKVGSNLNQLARHFNSGGKDTEQLRAQILGKQQDIEEDHTYDTSRMEAFLVPAGTAVEVYATTLHYAPCHVKDEGFRCVIVLPRDTNLDMEPVEVKDPEDRLLFARNKWLIGHAQGGLPEGAFIGLKGENLSV